MAGRPFTKEQQLGSGRKKYRRLVASPKTWARLHEERQGGCVVCRYLGVTQTFSSSLHHVVARSKGGDDLPENLVPLCGDGTRGHHGDVEAHRGVVRQTLAAAIQRDEPAVYAYAVEKLGEDGFLRVHGVRFGEAAA